MHKRQYSNKITEKTKYITFEQGTERYSLGRTTLMKIAKENGALCKIGKSSRLKLDKMDEIMESCIV